MRIGFFPNMGKSTIMAVLKMAAHICREEQIEDIYQMILKDLILIRYYKFQKKMYFLGQRFLNILM